MSTSRFETPSDRKLAELQKRQDAAVERGDLAAVNDLAVEIDRLEDSMEGVDRTLRQRQVNAVAASRPGTVSSRAEIGALRRRLRSSADGHVSAAAELANEYEDRRMPDNAYGQFRGRVNAAVEDLRRDAELEKLLARDASARVTSEPGPYSDESSPNSWVADTMAWAEMQRDPAGYQQPSIRAAGVDMSKAAVLHRLGQHTRDISDAISRGTEFGKRAEALISDSVRCEEPYQHERRAGEAIAEARSRRESRAIGTDGGIAATAPGESAAFVPPAIVLHEWARYRSPFASFATACREEQLPTYGLKLYVPQVTPTGSTVETQVEGEETAHSSPVVGLNESDIVTKAGAVKISQQLLDRAGPGISGDIFMFGQIKNQLMAAIDSYALAQALTEAASVTDNEAFALVKAKGGVGGFYADVKQAKAKLADQAGVRLKATHIHASPDFVDYIGAWADEAGRPVLTPAFDDNCLPIRSSSDPAGEGYSGYVVEGCALYEDANIPSVGTAELLQVIVSRPDDILVFLAPPVPYCYPESYSSTLQAELGVRQYVAVVRRHGPNSVVTISGTAYKASTFS